MLQLLSHPRSHSPFSHSQQQQQQHQRHPRHQIRWNVSLSFYYSFSLSSSFPYYPERIATFDCWVSDCVGNILVASASVLFRDYSFVFRCLDFFLLFRLVDGVGDCVGVVGIPSTEGLFPIVTVLLLYSCSSVSTTSATSSRRLDDDDSSIVCCWLNSPWICLFFLL